MNKYWQILILVVLAVVIVIAVPKKKDSVMAPEVTDFESCQKAGGIITDGDPVICTMPDGSKFEEAQTQEPEVTFVSPQYGDLVASPLKVSGTARGNWFFEANLPVTLKDQTGKTIAQQGMHADADWMTEDFVPFSGTLEFATPTTDFGVLIISKDNPSGDPQYDASYAIPVRFK